jgi:hypothetical protein
MRGTSTAATPMSTTTGANTQPKTRASERPTKPSRKSMSAMKARKARSMAATLIASTVPSAAPAAAASTTFAWVRSTTSFTSPRVCGSSSSGIRIFER